MSAGLDGIIAADTVLSHVDGAAGRLVLRGLDVERAAQSLDFEGMTALLWQGFHPLGGRPDDLRAAIGQARGRVAARLPALLPAISGLSAVEALRLLLASLPDGDAAGDAVMVVAAMPVFIAALDRRARGLAPVAPDVGAGHAADFLRMMTGVDPDPALARALDTYLVTVSDHGLNASTFAARIVASTRAGMVSSIVAGLCALKGPLHGGAPGPVLDMLDAVGDAAAAPAWIAAELAAGRRLMGFGHRIYRVRDPRAEVLKRAVRSLSSPRILLAEQVEQAALTALSRHRPDRPLETNVEFYTALLLDAVGLRRDLFTPVFAMGRVAGWTAHVMEQEATGRLMRPASRYVGPLAA
ncbi:citrate synthase/methylcitrate synthase [Niveispirillum lacus]|uniref:Citrate synthase n=1 Tax=Niveispirillum lacus TaxID=1981099 RepID=A0A255Z417_9PROT|nr:citrate synthase/methylcitrate synthase [Niveispirillum lacus]OYQ36247.1 citrate synthase/methylcitrate synthase [Niveispirillum lacus]